MTKAQFITKVADLNTAFNASSDTLTDRQDYLKDMIAAVGDYTGEDMSLETSAGPTTVQGWPCDPE